MIETTNMVQEEYLQTGTVAEIQVAVPSEAFMSDSIIQENKIKISLLPSKRKKTKKVNVTIEGSFNISNALLVKENCIKLMEHFDVISIMIKNIEDVDLAALQLLHMLKTSGELNQKTITIDSELAKEDRTLIQSAGLIDLLIKQQISE